MIFGENKHHHDNQPTSLAAYEDWRNRIVGVTILCATNAILYMSSALHSRRSP
ncbi:hypothetical protein D918_01250 [Trichuris suis]|nr:hypothetical protein D918_01250 [Trichuris suis]